MYKYKFLNILDTFSDKEFKQLGKFINSPYFNESNKMIELYEFVKRYYYNHTFDILTAELISEEICKTKTYDSVKTRKTLSDFNRLVENFLTYSSLDKDLAGKKAYLLSRLKKKELDKFYNTEIDDLKKIIDNSSRDSKSYYFSRLKFADEELSMKKYDLLADKKTEKIKELINSADYFYIFVKLYTYHIIVQNNLVVEGTTMYYGFENFEKLIKDIEKNEEHYESKEPGIYLYYLALKLIMMKSPDKIYPEIENYIEQNRKLLNSGDIEFCVYTIVNYIVNEISSGKYEKIDTAVMVFKRIDEMGFFINLNEINHYIFIRIIDFSLNMKDIVYAEEFIWRYFSKLKMYKEDSMNLAIASLRFAQGRYSEANEHINKINYKTYEFYLFANSILLKVFYEENSLKFINPLVDSFKHFLKRNKHIPVYYKESYSLFMTYLTRLTSLKKKNRKDIFKFEYELSNERNFYGKKWIEEKVSELAVGDQS